MLYSLTLLFSLSTGAHAPEKVAFSPKYSFDSLNRLRSVRDESGATQWIARDLGGRAVAQTMTNLLGKIQTSELFQNDGAHRIGASAKRFVYGRSLDEMLFQESGAEQLSPIVTHLGSTEKLINAAGAITQQYKYDAFGAPIAGDAKVFSQLFAGAHYDNKSKLYDLRNRHYDPRIGRFLSRDPLGMHADAANMGNAYAYVGNNPLNRRDPLGLFTGDEKTNPNRSHSILADLIGDQINLNTLSPQDHAMVFGGLDSFGPSSDMYPPIPMGNPINWGGIGTRLGGGLRVMGGGVETAIGGGLAYGLGWTGIGAWAGIGIASHGLDQVQAGARTAWTGNYTQSVTEMGITEYNTEIAGLDRPTAEAAAAVLDTTVSVLTTFGASSGTQAARGGLALATASGKTVALAAEVAVELPAAVAATHAGALLMTGDGPGSSTDCEEDDGRDPDSVERIQEIEDKLSQIDQLSNRLSKVDSSFTQRIGGWGSRLGAFGRIARIDRILNRASDAMKTFEFRWWDSEFSSWFGGSTNLDILDEKAFQEMNTILDPTIKNLGRLIDRAEQLIGKLKIK